MPMIWEGCVNCEWCGKQAGKHLEGIQSEPCPVGACSMNKSSSQDHEFVYIFKVLISSKEFEFIEQCSITWI